MVTLTLAGSMERGWIGSESRLGSQGVQGGWGAGPVSECCGNARRRYLWRKCPIFPDCTSKNSVFIAFASESNTVKKIPCSYLSIFSLKFKTSVNEITGEKYTRMLVDIYQYVSHSNLVFLKTTSVILKCHLLA